MNKCTSPNVCNFYLHKNMKYTSFPSWIWLCYTNDLPTRVCEGLFIGGRLYISAYQHWTSGTQLAGEGRGVSWPLGWPREDSPKETGSSTWIVSCSGRETLSSFEVVTHKDGRRALHHKEVSSEGCLRITSNLQLSDNAPSLMHATSRQPILAASSRLIRSTS